jgi:putative ribosome biogenesis GTPase RsgA
VPETLAAAPDRQGKVPLKPVHTSNERDKSEPMPGLNQCTLMIGNPGVGKSTLVNVNALKILESMFTD